MATSRPMVAGCDRQDVHIVAWRAVQRCDDEAAQAVQRDRLRQERIDVVEERPRTR